MRDAELVYSINEGPGEGVVVIRLEGPLTLGNMFQFQDELRRIHPPFTIFDLSQAEYLDSAGLGVLMNFYVSAEKNGRKVVLVGVSERVSALLELTHVKTLFGIFPTVEAAAASR